MFISLLVSSSGIDDYLVTTIYVKEGNGWKLRTVYFGDYSFNKMSAIELYENAKSLKEKGYKIPAILYMNISTKMLRPAPFLQYKKEAEINDFAKKLYEELKNQYTFPSKIKENNQEVCGLDIKCMEEGMVPVIKYITKIKLDDRDALKKEANETSPEVLNMYPGIKDTFKIFMFEAYSENPIDPKKTYNCYRTIIK